MSGGLLSSYGEWEQVSDRVYIPKSLRSMFKNTPGYKNGYINLDEYLEYKEEEK